MVPEISRFLGIVISMFFKEHNPPHFHAEYNGMIAAIDIATFGIMEGKLPPKVLGIVVEWAEEHQQELLENWNSMRVNGVFHKIKPLV